MVIEDNDNNEAHILKIHQIAAALAPSAKVPAIYNSGEMSLLNLEESWAHYGLPPFERISASKSLNLVKKNLAVKN